MKKIVTTDEFNQYTKRFWENNDKPYAFGLGEGIYDNKGKLITVRWLTINVDENLGTAAILMSCNDMSADTIIEMYFEPFLDDGENHSNINALKYLGEDYPIFKVYQTKEELTKKSPEDLVDVNFRHALVSRRYFEPNILNINGHFGLLPNLVWTMKYAYTFEDYQDDWFNIIEEDGMPICHDKFPPMYWANPAPIGVRVANTTMIRHGAHLAEGTTVMHYGFVNFNAGSLGEAMIESRVGGGITIGDGTDVAAGSGFLGTMSGGNNRVLNTGTSNLVGAMSELGIILGNGNQVAAGVTLLANSKVFDVRNDEWKVGSDFDNCNNTLFLFNTKEGRLEARDVKKNIELNNELHDN